MAIDGPDRRFDDRTQVSLLVRLKFPRLEDFRYRYTKDISKGGIYLLANVARPIGTRIVVHLLPPGDDTGLELVGEVAYIVTPDQAKAEGRSPGMGVRFIDLTSEKRRAIEAYLVGLSTSLVPAPAFNPSKTVADSEMPTTRFPSVRPPPPPSAREEEPTTVRMQQPVVQALPSFDADQTEPTSRLPDQYLEAEARDQLERVKNCSLYEALGLTSSTRTVDVRRAYLALTKKYHPDNYFRRASATLTAVLEELYERLTDAYDTLSSAEKRAAYDAKNGVVTGAETSGSNDDALRKAAARPPHPMQVQQAIFLVMDARKAIRAGNPKEAVQMLRSAVSFDPT
ncbi:MAG: DnaJ domain-containing protein, partial [Deltaproteobacteria bacterium]|nr:DnaJ domain-containing protein [Deltaproteobacteria bacterium]